MNKEHRAILERMYQLFKDCPDSNEREYERGWSIKEVLGHLLDSLSNNHQRLSRYTPSGEFHFPGYHQDEFVSRAHYATFDFQSLLSLWYQYNLLFLHLVEHIPQEDLAASTITVGDRPAVTIEALIHDYFAHMEIHERQIHRILKT